MKNRIGSMFLLLFILPLKINATNQITNVPNQPNIATQQQNNQTQNKHNASTQQPPVYQNQNSRPTQPLPTPPPAHPSSNQPPVVTATMPSPVIQQPIAPQQSAIMPSPKSTPSPIATTFAAPQQPPLLSSKPQPHSPAFEAFKNMLLIAVDATACTSWLPSLLNQTLLPDEKTELANILSQKISNFYNTRNKATITELDALQTLLQNTRQNASTVNIVPQKYLETVTALKQITPLKTLTDFSQRLMVLITTPNVMTANVDLYEKQAFLDEVENTVNMRTQLKFDELANAKTASKQKAEEFNKRQAEITQLQILLTNMAQQENIFDAKICKKLKKMAGTVLCFMTLINPPPSKTFVDLIATYERIIPSLNRSKEAAYEYSLFTTKTIPLLCGHYGNLNLNDLNALHSFLDKIIKTPNLLAASQISTLMSQMQDIQKAQLIATKDKTYIDALIAKAMAEKPKNIETYHTILTVLSSHTSEPTRKAFIIAVNALFVDRNTIDKKRLMSFLENVNKKKLSASTHFLNHPQKMKLKEWHTTLQKEIKNDEKNKKAIEGKEKEIKKKEQAEKEKIAKKAAATAAKAEKKKQKQQAPMPI